MERTSRGLERGRGKRSEGSYLRPLPTVTLVLCDSASQRLGTTPAASAPLRTLLQVQVLALAPTLSKDPAICVLANLPGDFDPL